MEIIPQNFSSSGLVVLEELGNKQTHKLTHWHPIAFIEWFIYLLVFFSCFISWKYYVFRIINSLISTFCMNVAWFLEDRLRMQKFQHFALPEKKIELIQI